MAGTYIGETSLAGVYGLALSGSLFSPIGKNPNVASMQMMGYTGQEQAQISLTTKILESKAAA